MRRFYVLISLLVLVIVLAASYSGRPAVAQEAAPSPTQPRPAADLLHIVQAGQTLTDIAALYNVPVAELVAVNGLANQNRLDVGQGLVIPATPPPATATNAPPATSTPDTVPVTDPDITLVPVAEADPDAAAPDTGEAVAMIPTASVPLEAWSGWPLNLGIISPGGTVTRDIYLRGQELGNNPRAFSKIGDCNSVAPFFLARFDDGTYDLGPYSYLQPVIDHFTGSFARESLAVWVGNHMWAIHDPMFAPNNVCEPDESPIECEFRVHRPSIVLVRLGTNDTGSAQFFEDSLREIVHLAMREGVIPVLATKADNVEGDDRNNAIVRRVAAEFGLPLWDFAHVARTLPANGLRDDGIHLSYAAPDYTQSEAYQSGHAVQNLTALMVLDAVWRSVMQEVAAVS